MKFHQDIRKYLHRSYKNHFVKVGIALILGVLFFGASFLSAPASQAQAHVQTSTVARSADVQSMIDQVFGPYAPSALRIAQCESGFNPSAYNPMPIGYSHAQGVFQILYPSTWSGTSQAGLSPYDAWANIVAAHEIFVRDGYSWREWACQA